MKKLLFALALIASVSTVSAQHIGTEYRLKKVVQVPGRQGIAADENYYSLIPQHYYKYNFLST